MIFIIPDFLTPNINYSFSFKPRIHYSLFGFHPRGLWWIKGTAKCQLDKIHHYLQSITMGVILACEQAFSRAGSLCSLFFSKQTPNREPVHRLEWSWIKILIQIIPKESTLCQGCLRRTVFILALRLQRHPTTVFCIICSEKQILPRIFYYLRKAKDF